MSYVKKSQAGELAGKLSFLGQIDLTYRCNNNCVHCWCRIPHKAPEKQDELTYDEIRSFIDAGCQAGCSKWHLCGGEPLIRDDFLDIFDYITSKSLPFGLNTNATLITPTIAKRFKKKGLKLVSMYGATAKTHDAVTRTPGSFELMIQGVNYLKEAGAGFTMQIVPMRANLHELDGMISLAQSLSGHYRVGAIWLYLSAYGDPVKNRSIREQRLSPEEIFQFDTPYLIGEQNTRNDQQYCQIQPQSDYPLSRCIRESNRLHIDAYAGMSFCSFIKDPALRYDLRSGSFADYWNSFLPSIVGKVKGGTSYQQGCKLCPNRASCKWCAAYAYLEHGEYGRKIDFFCDYTRASKAYAQQWQKEHRRFYQIGDVTIQVDSARPFTDDMFAAKFDLFRVDQPGDDVVCIEHHDHLPELPDVSDRDKVWNTSPWRISKKGQQWIYEMFADFEEKSQLRYMALFNEDYSRAQIFHNRESILFRGQRWGSLIAFPSDIVWLSHVFLQRQGCFFHASAIVHEGRGYLFLGHSEAGKSTIARLCSSGATVLCDERILLRKKGGKFWVYGTWSHGDFDQVSPLSAPLAGLYFLKQSAENSREDIIDKKKVTFLLYEQLFRVFESSDTINVMLDIIEDIVQEVPAYWFGFRKDLNVLDFLQSNSRNKV